MAALILGSSEIPSHSRRLVSTCELAESFRGGFGSLPGASRVSKLTSESMKRGSSGSIATGKRHKPETWRRCVPDSRSFETPLSVFQWNNLVPGWLLKRYKRFLADVEFEKTALEEKHQCTVHCPNTGPMTGLLDQERPRVLVSSSDNPKRKHKHTLELIYVDTPWDVWVGIHSALANNIVRALLDRRLLKDLEPYDDIKPEVKYGDKGSRVDFLLTTSGGRELYVEVKSVTLAATWSNASTSQGNASKADRIGLFPDTVSKRAQNHIQELMKVVSLGKDAACVFVIQRGDCSHFAPCHEKDPEFAKLIVEAHNVGVKILAVRCAIVQGADSQWIVQYLGKADIDWGYGISGEICT